MDCIAATTPMRRDITGGVRTLGRAPLVAAGSSPRLLWCARATAGRRTADFVAAS
ncbi:hypothetical protein [Mumia flava]|uniref:hypothetical protein n=1 Tax=Mumia flava TaxID=1348852 RepID=UPI0012FDA33E|nr:hypothetical protein [Mumia flava]